MLKSVGTPVVLVYCHAGFAQSSRPDPDVGGGLTAGILRHTVAREETQEDA